MRLLLILLLFLPAISKAQPKVPASAHLLIGCGYIGQTSDNVRRFQGYVQAQNFGAIRRALFSGNPDMQVLSVVALQEFKDRHMLQLTPEEEVRIKELTNSGSTVSICNGCTNHFEGTLKTLFAPEAWGLLSVRAALFPVTEKN